MLIILFVNYLRNENQRSNSKGTKQKKEERKQEDNRT